MLQQQQQMMKRRQDGDGAYGASATGMASRAGVEDPRLHAVSCCAFGKSDTCFAIRFPEEPRSNHDHQPHLSSSSTLPISSC